MFSLIAQRSLARAGVASRFYSASSLKDSPAGSLRDVTGAVVNPSEYFADKKAVIISVPGAFTPVCTNQHVPGFLAKLDQFKSAGVDVVACVSVNDHFVMKAWSEKVDPESKLVMFADPDAAFTKSVGQEVDLSGGGLGVRSKRYAMVVENGEVKQVATEKSPGDLDVTSAEQILSKLQ
mmetsp:Transcript_6674/g.16843  ORF Transcript_6674/g.16843 Transcript_6674/m.16843 type:complete len:179 (-) Transcript_6674:64-600(-)|eukprot:CAMPEP_0177641044 /NCGR_PEP_ID=MMETSP0447-20121125/6863_1 /TAXON_ID=0 /ORGANISM="Stygamoeba regulata, Strain BSH-02190019" /LENGTH=178 /DNA_ID=CAMNT_0019143149 /DNA_START=44 /DNA_END=580 /DNA_ORIENTATION=-